MIPMTLAEVAAVVHGRVVDAEGEPDVHVTGEAFVDSRRVVEGGLFVAINGERVDGHDYAASAVGAGAAAMLGERPVGAPGVVVDDSVAALALLARHVMTHLPLVHVVGITGSQGKTSAKDILAQLLEQLGETVSTAGSFNNEIGAPLTALRVRPSTSYLVAEMGARGRGHIRDLAEMVQPSIGVVLNVGLAHVGEFGSREEIAVAKRELVEALPGDGLAVLNADDDRVLAMRDHTAATVTTFGAEASADVRVAELRIDDEGRPCFVLAAGRDSAPVALPLVGAHQAHNAAAAAAVALHLGMPFGDLIEALHGLSLRSRWRMEVSRTAQGVTVINDAYNANPDSMRSALTTLAELGGRAGAGRCIAILGEMRELGAQSPAEHEAVGRLAATVGVARLVVVGEDARSILEGAVGTTATDLDTLWVPDADAAIEAVRGALRPGDVVLVKASRAAGLERVAQALTATDETRAKAMETDQ